MSHTNLFLAGAPKCGTSGFFHTLSRHQNITASSPKETFYFLDADHPLLNKKLNYWKDGIRGFDSFFEKRDTPTIRLEASTHLLYQKHAPEILSKHYPDAHIAFILRNPSDRIRSSFEYTYNNLARFRREISFDEYIHLLISSQKKNLKKYIYEGPSLYVLSNDLEYGKYINYLPTWYNFFPKKNIKILFFEDLADSPSNFISSTLSWLDIPNNNQQKVARKNTTYNIRSKRLHNFSLKLSSLIPDSYLKKHLREFYLKSQTTTIKMAHPSLQTINMLADYYKKPNENLATFTGKNNLWNLKK